MCSAGVAVRAILPRRSGRECGDRRKRNPVGCGTATRLGLLFIIENVAAVRPINHDTVVAANRHGLIGLQRALRPATAPRRRGFGTVFREFIGQPLDIKMLLKVSPLRVSSNALRSLAERDDRPVNRRA